MNPTVLMGWDAAWTPNGSGAWAVARGKEVILHETTPRGEDLLGRLAQLLDTLQPSVLAVDLPFALGGVSGWRTADLATTRAFSRFGCPVHSPTPERPGRWGLEIQSVLEKKGYHLGVADGDHFAVYAEVYPHTVMLDIHRSARRIPYKSGRSKQYWPEAGLAERTGRLVETYRNIWSRLGERWRLPPFPLPPEPLRMSGLKAVEDQIDALACLEAARGIQTGRYRPYGDETAAIWNPDASALLCRAADAVRQGGGGQRMACAGHRMGQEKDHG